VRSSPVRGGGAGLKGDEGVAFLVREAVSKLKEAPGPAYGERGGVRWLGTDGVAETETVRWRRLTGGRQRWGRRQNSQGRSLL
jgi:hypothetical protein